MKVMGYNKTRQVQEQRSGNGVKTGKKKEFFDQLYDIDFINQVIDSMEGIQEQSSFLSESLEDISDFDKMMNTSVLKPVSTIISKNAPCPCGSGKQYKRCCGK